MVVIDQIHNQRMKPKNINTKNTIFFKEKELLSAPYKVVEIIRNKNIEILNLNNLAFYDELTWLLNRHWLKKTIKEKFNSWEKISVISIDIENLSEVNNNFWPILWDEAIKSTANILKQIFRFNKKIRNDDIICRYGWDEFMIILPTINEELIVDRVGKIEKSVKEKQKEIAKREKNNYHFWIHITYNSEHTINDYQIANNKNNLKLKQFK